MSRDDLHFTWDPAKNAGNQKKHRVDFSEACSVFFDDQARLIDDPDHSSDEDRFIIMGRSARFRILLVCHCYRRDDAEIRIVSARKALKHEIKHYQG